MDKTRKKWQALVVLVVAVVTGAVLFLFAVYPALAAQFFFAKTTLQDFNEGVFYHTALSWIGDGEVRLLPIGLGQPWQPGNNTGLPKRAGLATVYVNGYLYALGGDYLLGDARNNVYYARVYTDVFTATGRLSDWQETTPLPTDIYPEGVCQHEAVALTFTDTQKTFLYVFGGMEEHPPSTMYDNVLFAEVLSDGTLGPWQETVALPMARFGHESVVLSDTLYVLGGTDNLGTSPREVYYTRPNRNTGEIADWNETTAPLPELGVGGYFHAALGVSQGRFYVYGGSSGPVDSTYSYYVHFAHPEADGDILDWTYNTEVLPVNCWASEGAGYSSGLLLAIAGAWSCGAGCTPSGDVQVSLADGDTGQTTPWYDTVAMSPPRFLHSVTQDDDGFLYSIGGATGYSSERLNNVDIALPYGGGESLPLQTAADLEAAADADEPIFAPFGRYTSPYIDVRIIDQPWYHATLTSFSWNTTITDADGMTLTMSYRYYSPTAPGGWLPWSEPVASPPGTAVTTTIDFPPGTIGDYFQYRAFLSAALEPPTNTYAVQTPLLNAIRIGVLSPPDLEALTLTVICDSCPAVIPVDKPVQIEFAAVNKGSNLPENFYAAIFYTTTENYSPYPPDVPPGCEDYDPPTVTCPLVLPQYASNYQEDMPPYLMRTTYTFTTPGLYWLVAQVDYNNTPAHLPPRYDVDELIETNNITRIPIAVGVKRLYLPLLTKRVQ